MVVPPMPDVWGVPIDQVVRAPNPVLASVADRVAAEVVDGVSQSAGFNSSIA